jgi:hypothetical protein
MDCLIEYVHDVQVDSDVKTVPCACADLELFLITMACVFHAARIAQQGRPVQRRKTNAHACSPTKIPGNAQENALKARLLSEASVETVQKDSVAMLMLEPCVNVNQIRILPLLECVSDVGRTRIRGPELSRRTTVSVIRGLYGIAVYAQRVNLELCTGREGMVNPDASRVRLASIALGVCTKSRALKICFLVRVQPCAARVV